MSRRTALALLGPALGLVAWRAAAALRRRAERYVLFDRPQSNNCARVRLWIYLRGLEARFDVRATSHAAQARDAFRALNPAAKIPLLVILDGAGTAAPRAATPKRPRRAAARRSRRRPSFWSTSRSGTRRRGAARSCPPTRSRARGCGSSCACTTSTSRVRTLARRGRRG